MFSGRWIPYLTTDSEKVYTEFRGFKKPETNQLRRWMDQKNIVSFIQSNSSRRVQTNAVK